MWLVVGLGNPGREYAGHRHNIGFGIVDELARRTGAERFRSKFSGEIARTELGDEDAWLLKPQTFMNLSGDSVQPCAAFYKIPAQRVIVCHDDLDLPFGDIRLKRGGGHGGNNGVRSVMQRLGNDFCRLRFGIGRPPAEYRDTSSWVLSNFRPEEQDKLDKYVEISAKAVLDISARGFDAAMKRRNTRPKPKKKRQPKKEPAASEAPTAADEAAMAEKAPEEAVIAKSEE
jgi:PTH1 family peptidyl-tRNA hydrolase